ncbi:uncharacterized protein FA14DRAFT_172701 [Meira miltonrushii]|uniref:Uncharacterized protein n=1 Tax=Meira miltonrushii TaxID=1280837 RepID=A0A316VKS2_9BASI|nr:uncharacterized protein FA14DRAFT_172701 [Meira miltonrushii]PWN36125.1 hypothetical protein FA14DRAFT_172701 [Meira miltonrushii]
MKFAFSSALLLATLTAVLAQDSSSAAPSSSSSAAPASSSMMSSQSSSGGDAQATSRPTCTLVSGNPKNQPFGCIEGASTVTPPYNSESLQSFLIGGYNPGVEGHFVSSVASNFANSVTKLYPTLTESYGAIVTQYVNALEQSISDYKPDSAPANLNVPSKLGAAALVAAAVVAGGAFVL